MYASFLARPDNIVTRNFVCIQIRFLYIRKTFICQQRCLPSKYSTKLVCMFRYLEICILDFHWLHSPNGLNSDLKGNYSTRIYLYKRVCLPYSNFTGHADKTCKSYKMEHNTLMLGSIPIL